MNDTVLLEKRHAIAVITLNRPERLNALNDDMMFALREALSDVEHDAATRAVIVRGAGNAFMAGGDVAMFHAKRNELAELFRDSATVFHDSIHCMRRMPKPIVACVHGACAGGGLSLMLACDVAIAADSAQFTLAYARIGASPDGGSTYFLPRIIGTRKTLELAMLPDAFDAEKAQALGIINWVVPAEQLPGETEKIAQRLATGPTHAFANTKKLVNATFEQPMAAQLDMEIALFADCASGQDFKEGIAAFVEKRKTQFKGS